MSVTHGIGLCVGDTEAIAVVHVTGDSTAEPRTLVEPATLRIDATAAVLGVPPTEPGVLRRFVSVVGDPNGVVAPNGTVYLAEDLVATATASLLATTIRQFPELRDGDSPVLRPGPHVAVVAAHPSHWSDALVLALRGAFDRAGLDSVRLVSDAEASHARPAVGAGIWADTMHAAAHGAALLAAMTDTAVIAAGDVVSEDVGADEVAAEEAAGDATALLATTDLATNTDAESAVADEIAAERANALLTTTVLSTSAFAGLRVSAPGADDAARTTLVPVDDAVTVEFPAVVAAAEAAFAQAGSGAFVHPVAAAADPAPAPKDPAAPASAQTAAARPAQTTPAAGPSTRGSRRRAGLAAGTLAALAFVVIVGIVAATGADEGAGATPLVTEAPATTTIRATTTTPPPTTTATTDSEDTVAPTRRRSGVGVATTPTAAPPAPVAPPVDTPPFHWTNPTTTTSDVETTEETTTEETTTETTTPAETKPTETETGTAN